MSDISVTARQTALFEDDDRLETVVVPPGHAIWARQILIAAAVGIGVVVFAALSVALFLR
jgi:hypothetical protein